MGEQEPQNVMLEIATDTIDPRVLAELLTRAGYDVRTVECERGGTWNKQE